MHPYYSFLEMGSHYVAQAGLQWLFTGGNIVHHNLKLLDPKYSPVSASGAAEPQACPTMPG